jgi:hypothetical protein
MCQGLEAATAPAVRTRGFRLPGFSYAQAPGAPVVLRLGRRARSNQAYVLCFLALLALSRLELDALALFEVAVGPRPRRRAACRSPA